MRSLGAERRAAVVRLLRETALSIDEISARTGINAGTIHSWNARAGWIRPPRRRWILATRWPAARRAAVARLLNAPGNDPADVAEAMGLGHYATETLLSAFGIAPDSPSTLRAHLRGHVARQIAAFDTALSGAGAAVIDSARVLRDLGGLKRLLDDIDAGRAPDGSGEGGDGGTERDLPALRAEIARRYADFVGRRLSA